MEANNMSAMRNALIVAKANFDSMGANALEGELNLDAVAMICAIMSARIEAALSAPPRNCDVGTAEEQVDRFRVFCQTEKCGRRRCGSGSKSICIDKCALAWAQMLFANAEGGEE